MTALVLLALVGCGDGRISEFSGLKDQPFPVATVDPAAPWTLSSTPLQGARSTAAWGTAFGLWWLAVDGPGLDADFERVQYTPAVLSHAGAAGESPHTHPLPPMFDDVEPRDAVALVGELVGTRSVRATDDHTLVIVYEDTAWVLDDTDTWRSYPAPPEDGVDWIWAGDAFRRHREDGFEFFDGALTNVAVQLPQEGFGWLHTVDDTGGWATWVDEERFCAARASFDGALTDTTCRELGFRVDRASTVAGTADEAWVLLSARPGTVAYRRWVRLVPGAIEDTDLPVPSPDDASYDGRSGRVDGPALPEIAPGRWMDPRTGEVWDTVETGPVTPAAGCTNPGETAAERARAWCVPSTVEPRRSLGGTALSKWALYVDDHDGSRRIYAQQFVSEVVTLDLDDPGLIPEDLVVELPVPTTADGTPLPDSCLGVVNASGASASRNADGSWTVPLGGSWRATVGPCDLDDGGPPVLYASRVLIETGGGSNTYPEVLRAWPLPGVIEPLQAVTNPDVDGQVVLLDTGWHALARSDDGLDLLWLDAADAPAPAILPGPRYLTAYGSVVDPDGSEEVIDLDADPQDTRILDGHFLVDAGSDWLRVTDLSQQPAAVVLDETGPRSTTLVDLSHDGAWVIEAKTGRLDLRHTATNTVTLLLSHAASNDVLADLAISGDQAIASSADQFPSSIAHAQLNSTTGAATVTTLCSYCGLHAWFEDGVDRWRVVDGAHEQWLDGQWQLLRTLPTNRNPYAPVDPYGWSYLTFGEAFDMRTSEPTIAVDGTLEPGTSTWLHAPPASWWQISGPGEFTSLAGDTRDSLVNRASPLMDGLGAQRVNGLVVTGDWSAIWPNVRNTTAWGPALLYTPEPPFQKSRVCQVVSTDTNDDAERRYGCLW